MATHGNLLVIAPKFFDYYKMIIKCAETKGLTTDYICDAPNDSNISKALGRWDKRFLYGFMIKYFQEQVLPIISSKLYDYVLLVGGMTFSFVNDMIQKIRYMQPQAKFVMYQWDSEKNLPYAAGIHSCFDVIFTFDRIDCAMRRYYRFLPLFYSPAYEKIGRNSANFYVYDCSYIGTAHPKKIHDINLMAKCLSIELPEQFIYHYMPSKLKYYYHKVLAPEYRGVKISDLQFKKLTIDQATWIFQHSRCILDAPQEGQAGLTMRTLECLGAKRKLITTNTDIINYDFYNPTNILVFSGTFDANSPFFTSPYMDLQGDIYRKYSLKNWLDTLLFS